jgi:hypothetical protein
LSIGIFRIWNNRYWQCIPLCIEKHISLLLEIFGGKFPQPWEAGTGDPVFVNSSEIILVSVIWNQEIYLRIGTGWKLNFAPCELWHTQRSDNQKWSFITYFVRFNWRNLSCEGLQGFFFLKWGQKLCSNLFIKKKRIAQLINEKLGENRYNKTRQPTTHRAQTQRRSTKRTGNSKGLQG